MIKIAICDDESNVRACLSSLITAQPCPCEIVEYASADGCLMDYREIDLIFLDIELAPDRPDGMALARKIRERASGKQPVIIFVTGYDRYVFDVFDVGAFQYLLKPVDEKKFAQVFARAVGQIMAERENPRRGRVLTFQSANTGRTIPLDSIIYIESSGHKVVLHLRDGEFVCYAKLRDLELELQGRFFRIHKGYLVNLSYVEGYGKTCQRQLENVDFRRNGMSFFAGQHTSVYSLNRYITCRLEARQALIYQLVLGLTGKNGKYNYSKAVHVYPPFFDISCSAKNYKIAPAMT